MRAADGPRFPDPCGAEQIWALAVSGGSDSMALLHLAIRQRDRKYLRVLTVDHGLRDGSRAEAEQVGRLCKALGVAHAVLPWAGPKPTRGIQAKARQARYDLMAAWCRDVGVTILLTGHTMDDQAETVAMRARRTDSNSALAGIWPETIWKGVTVMRPLLGLRREELRKLLQAEGHAWIDDPSNDNPVFERVRVRRDMAPADVAPLAARAEAARQAAVRQQGAARSWLKAQAQVDDRGLIQLPRTACAALPLDVAVAVLGWAVGAAGGGASAERRSLIILAKRAGAPETGRVTLGGAVIAFRRQAILIGREPGRIAPEPLVVGGEGRLLWDGRFVVSAPAGSRIVPAGIRCPKTLPDCPAFVREGLPRVTLPDGHAVFPHAGAADGVSVTLGERFCL